jgi:hypothetical protein
MATKTKSTKKAAAPKATKTAKAPKAAPAKQEATKPVAKTAKSKAAGGEAKAKKLSALDAAAQVLAGTKQSMNCKQLIETIAAKGLWTSPGGKTPHATLYSAILREINEKGADARFKKTERGQFAAA